MKRILFVGAAALVVSVVPAQNTVAPTITTATDYGVLATAGAQTVQDAVPVRHSVGRSLQLGARAAVRGIDAVATTHVGREMSSRFGIGVRVAEVGRVASADAQGTAQAGTSDSPPSTRMPQLGTHAVQIVFPARAGQHGVATVVWGGTSSANAGGGTAVDVDGDGTADFVARMNGTRIAQQFRVTAGRNGVVMHVATNGHAGVRGIGREGYAGEVAVFFEAANTGGRCTFTTFGRQCGVSLDGAVRPSPSAAGGDNVALLIQGPPRAFGALALGDQLRQPRPLPFGPCSLLIDPFAYANFFTDRNGDAAIGFHVPGRWHMSVDFQALTLHMPPSGLELNASNGLNLTCR